MTRAEHLAAVQTAHAELLHADGTDHLTGPPRNARLAALDEDHRARALPPNIAARVAAAQAARWALALAYHSMARAIARQIAGGTAAAEDLTQTGLIGIAQAARMWRPDAGAGFEHYARWWARQTMTRAAPAHMAPAGMRFATGAWERRIKVRKEARLRAAHGAPTDIGAIAADMAVDPVILAACAVVEAPSLDAPMNGSAAREMGPTIAATVADPATTDPTDHLDLPRVRALVAALPDRERHVLTRAYGLDGAPPQSGTEIGKAHGVSRERIRQIHSAVLQDMRRSLGVRA